MHTILVVGGTGMLGEPVARRLAADGYRVRVLSRTPEAARARFGTICDVIGGDVRDPRALAAALEGCHGVHISFYVRLSPDLERAGVVNVAGAAAQARIARITYLSGASVCAENCWYPGTKAKFDAEAAIRASGAPYTIFKASYFMETLRNFVRGDRVFVIGRQPHSYHWVAARDFARMVSKAFSTPAAANKDLFVYGPAPFTMRKALARYRAIVHPAAGLTPLPLWVAAVIARFPGREQLRDALPFFRYCDKVRAGGDPAEANALLGAPGTTLEEWCREQANPQVG